MVALQLLPAVPHVAHVKSGGTFEALQRRSTCSTPSTSGSRREGRLLCLLCCREMNAEDPMLANERCEQQQFPLPPAAPDYSSLVVAVETHSPHRGSPSDSHIVSCDSAAAHHSDKHGEGGLKVRGLDWRQRRQRRAGSQIISQQSTCDGVVLVTTASPRAELRARW